MYPYPKLLERFQAFLWRLAEPVPCIGSRVGMLLYDLSKHAAIHLGQGLSHGFIIRGKACFMRSVSPFRAGTRGNLNPALECS